MNAAALLLSSLLQSIRRPDLPWLAGGALLCTALGLFTACDCAAGAPALIRVAPDSSLRSPPRSCRG